MAFCFDPDDILGHSGTGQQTGSSWHVLAHPESGQQLCRWFELNVLCHLTALLPESDLAEHLLPSANPAYHHILTIYNYTCHPVMIFGDFGSKFGFSHATLLMGIFCFASVLFCFSATFNWTFTFLCTDVASWQNADHEPCYFYFAFEILQCEQYLGFSLSLTVG